MQDQLVLNETKDKEGSLKVDYQLPRWKVVAFSLAADIVTIYAKDQQDALELVSKGAGRHAGVEGPELIGHVIMPFDSPAAKDFIKQWQSHQVNMMKCMQEQHEKKKIVVPSMSIN